MTTALTMTSSLSAVLSTIENTGIRQYPHGLPEEP